MTLKEAIEHCEEVANDRAGCCEDCAEEHRQLAEWLKELKQLREQTRWIPVSERLPEKNGSYLIQVNSSDGTATITFVTVDHYNKDGTWLHCDNKRHKVIAWMPLPEPYRAESEE